MDYDGVLYRPLCPDDLGGVISIHAPREGGDDWLFRQKDEPIDFNPRPPRGGRLSDYQLPSALVISIHAPREGGDFTSGICSVQ